MTLILVVGAILLFAFMCLVGFNLCTLLDASRRHYSEESLKEERASKVES